MSHGELTPGDGLLLKAFVDHPADTVKWSYKAPPKTADGKPRYHLALWLGIWHEDSSSVDERLNALGWVFDPERAREQAKEKAA